MESSADHKARIREEFTRQAEAFAGAPAIMDPARIQRLVEAVAPAADSRLLDVACGPGHVALAFGARCRAVVGVDLTEAPLAIAESRRTPASDNVSFRIADVDALPFDRGEFDIVVCRFAFHHFDAPASALAEMVRVCRPGGTIAVEDLTVSEQPERAAYHDRFENLRDPSHTHAFPLSSLLQLFGGARVEVERVSTDTYAMQVQGWLARAHTPADQAAAARALIERDAAADLSGTRPFFQDGELWFHHHTATVVGRKL